MCDPARLPQAMPKADGPMVPPRLLDCQRERPPVAAPPTVGERWCWPVINGLAAASWIVVLGLFALVWCAVRLLLAGVSP